MATMVNQNITINAEDRIEDETSQVLTTSLLGCPELNLTRWQEVSNAAMGDYVYQEDRIDTQKTAYLSEYYPTTPYMCRNGTVRRALEDIMNNVTISMLSNSMFT
jgi:hypothetical protein